MCDADNVEDIFKINTKYNSDVITNQVNRVQEFYQNLGKGNINAGKEIAKVVVTDIGSLGHVYITWGQSNEDKTENQEAFFNYLERGEKENVK